MKFYKNNISMSFHCIRCGSVASLIKGALKPLTRVSHICVTHSINPEIKNIQANTLFATNTTTSLPKVAKASIVKVESQNCPRYTRQVPPQYHLKSKSQWLLHQHG
jgi:hypothetical protein